MLRRHSLGRSYVRALRLLASEGELFPGKQLRPCCLWALPSFDLSAYIGLVAVGAVAINMLLGC